MIKKLSFVIIAIAVLFSYPLQGFALNYGIGAWDAAGDPYNWSAYGFNGSSAWNWVWNATVQSGSVKVSSIQDQGATIYGDGLPDFAEVGWLKYSSDVPKFFVAWHNANGYNHVIYNAAPVNQAHNFTVTYQGYSPNGWGGTYLWYGWFDSTFALQVWNRTRYIAPVTAEEHNSGGDDGGTDFWSIRELNSRSEWQYPSNLGLFKDLDPWYYFSKIDNTHWKALRQ